MTELSQLGLSQISSYLFSMVVHRWKKVKYGNLKSMDCHYCMVTLALQPLISISPEREGIMYQYLRMITIPINLNSIRIILVKLNFKIFLHNS